MAVEKEEEAHPFHNEGNLDENTSEEGDDEGEDVEKDEKDLDAAADIDSELRWDRVVDQLHRSDGVAWIDLPRRAWRIPCRAFRVAAQVMDSLATATSKDPPSSSCSDGSSSWRLDPTASSSAHATGYHAAGQGWSRYNQYRQGLVLSDGLPLSHPDWPELGPSLQALEDWLHVLAVHCLAALERHVPSDPLWNMDNHMATNSEKDLSKDPGRSGDDDGNSQAASPLGSQQEQQHSTGNWPHVYQAGRFSSQWHLKRYVLPPPPTPPRAEDNDGEEIHLLPTHTDPSLISIIILDRPGKLPGAEGLRYQQRRGPSPTVEATSAGSSIPRSTPSTWTEVPFSGHGVAIIFVGSVLAQVTGNYFPAAKHGVVASASGGLWRWGSHHAASSSSGPPVDHEHSGTCPPRMAATLFVRPAPQALLTPWPFLPRSVAPPPTFEAWNARVARHYEKSKTRRGGLTTPPANTI